MNTLNRPSRIRAVITATVLGALASNLAAAATATNVNDAPAVTVKFSDLDLAKPQGAAALYGRIQAAAYSVCSSFDGRDLASKTRQKACEHQAIANAVNAVNLPTLYAVYNAKHPAATPNALVSMQIR